MEIKQEDQQNFDLSFTYVRELHHITEDHNTHHKKEDHNTHHGWHERGSFCESKTRPKPRK